MTTLSVMIITKNEAHDIADCLESISWADEIVVVDSGSSDNTVAICQTYTQKVQVTDWQGFGIQKNRALAMTSCDWVLSIDADERVTPELKLAIQTAIAEPGETMAFSIPRRSTYCGKIIRFGDWRNDRVVRLFKRGHAKFCDSRVHEALQVNGAVSALSAYLIHYAFKDRAEVMAKMEQYSTLGAQQKYAAGKKATRFTALSHGAWTFFRGYILRLGFLDGIRGLQLATSNAKGCYYRYMKLLSLL